MRVSLGLLELKLLRFLSYLIPFISWNPGKGLPFEDHKENKVIHLHRVWPQFFPPIFLENKVIHLHRVWPQFLNYVTKRIWSRNRGEYWIPRIRILKILAAISSAIILPDSDKSLHSRGFSTLSKKRWNHSCAIKKARTIRSDISPEDFWSFLLESNFCRMPVFM